MNNDDKTIRELIKQSELNPPSVDFTDSVMASVEKYAYKPKSNHSWTWAWILFFISAILLPFAILSVTWLYANVFEAHFKILAKSTEAVQWGLILLSGVAMLLQLDQLLKKRITKSII